MYANLVQQSTCLARHTGPQRPRPGSAAVRPPRRGRRPPGTLPALHALVSLQRSLAHAQLGDAAAFRSAIATARRELDRGPHEADSARTRFVRHSEITGYEALGSARLGAFTQATRLHEEVLDDTTRSPRDQAYDRVLLAANLVAAGDSEQAVSHGPRILPTLGSPLTSARGTARTAAGPGGR